MNLIMPEKIMRCIPDLLATAGEDDPMVQVKFFASWANWTWYATEYDGEDLFYGMIHRDGITWDYFRLWELEEVRGPGGLRIERDLRFSRRPISQIRDFCVWDECKQTR